jgi:hypothetical protein
MQPGPHVSGVLAGISGVVTAKVETVSGMGISGQDIVTYSSSAMDGVVSDYMDITMVFSCHPKTLHHILSIV